MGCEGYHEHELDGQIWYMPCESHDLSEQVELTEDISKAILNNLEHEEISDEWEIVDEIECDGEDRMMKFGLIIYWMKKRT